FSHLLLHDSAPTEISTLSLHDALPIYARRHHVGAAEGFGAVNQFHHAAILWRRGEIDRERHPHLVDVEMTLVVLLHQYANKAGRSEEHTSELQSRFDLVCRLLLEKKNK